ncbi:MAG: peptidoglycan-binding protein [Roseobacter sp.]
MPITFFLGVLLSLTVVLMHVSTPVVAQTQALPLTSDQHPSRLCLLRALARQPQSDLVLEVPFGSAGQPLNVPFLRAPETPDANVRLDYLIVSAAIESCVPFLDVAENSPLTLSVTRNGGLTLGGQQKKSIEQVTALPVLPIDQAVKVLSELVAPQALGEGSRETEEAMAMALDKPAIRDVQARLLTLGHDPNGIDGNLGRGTRAAIRDWQQAQGVTQTGYLNPAQHAHLNAASQPGLMAWLQDPENALLHNPPPPIPIGAHNMLGNWRYSANCGAGSKCPAPRSLGC